MLKRLKAFSINKAHSQVFKLSPRAPIRMQVRESRWAGRFGLVPRGTPCEEEVGPPRRALGRRNVSSAYVRSWKAGGERPSAAAGISVTRRYVRHWAPYQPDRAAGQGGMQTVTARDGPHLGPMSLRSSLPRPTCCGACSVWPFGLYGEVELREQFGLFGETHAGLSTEKLGLFGDRCWTLWYTSNRQP